VILVALGEEPPVDQREGLGLDRVREADPVVGRRQLHAQRPAERAGHDPEDGLVRLALLDELLDERGLAPHDVDGLDERAPGEERDPRNAHAPVPLRLQVGAGHLAADVLKATVRVDHGGQAPIAEHVAEGEGGAAADVAAQAVDADRDRRGAGIIEAEAGFVRFGARRQRVRQAEIGLLAEGHDLLVAPLEGRQDGGRPHGEETDGGAGQLLRVTDDVDAVLAVLADREGHGARSLGHRQGVIDAGPRQPLDPRRVEPAPLDSRRQEHRVASQLRTVAEGDDA